MIDVPERDFLGVGTASPLRMEALADWLEANLLFCGRTVSASDVADTLIQSQSVAADQDLANGIVSDGWFEVQRRQLWSGQAGTVGVTDGALTTQFDWEDTPIWSFFVLLSIQRMFPTWSNAQANYSVQGELFERVVEEICPAMFPGWRSYRTGWSPGNTKNIPLIVQQLTERLHVLGHANLAAWLPPGAKDGGLDIVCYRHFDDQREALPVYFLQCASGRNWRQKVGTPNADEWQKYLDSAVMPSTGIAAPFVIDNEQLRFAALRGQVVVLDRLRMLSAATSGGVELSLNLRKQVLDWMRPRVDCLPG